MEITNFQRYYLTPKLGEGNHGIVYAISPDHAVKLSKNCSLTRELNHLVNFYENGVSVPEPQGIFSVEIRPAPISLWNTQLEGLVMQRLYGTLVNQLDGDLREMADYLLKLETIKLLELGYIKTKSRQNTMYDLTEDRVYIIDMSDVCPFLSPESNEVRIRLLEQFRREV